MSLYFGVACMYTMSLDFGVEIISPTTQYYLTHMYQRSHSTI